MLFRSVTTDNDALFAELPAVASDGTISFTPADGASGLANVSIRAHDDGGTANGGIDLSAPQVVEIAVATYAEELGKYNGLIQADAAGPRENARFGSIKATVGRKGALTAKLVVGGRKYSLKGAVALTGEATFGKTHTPTAPLKRAGATTLALALALDTVHGTDRLTGTISDGGAPFAAALANRALYTAKINPQPPLMNPPADLPGKYTVVFAAPPGTGSGAAPAGDGIGFLKVSKGGKARIAGTLADEIGRAHV